jgi:hypothetical protein
MLIFKLLRRPLLVFSYNPKLLLAGMASTIFVIAGTGYGLQQSGILRIVTDIGNDNVQSKHESEASDNANISSTRPKQGGSTPSASKKDETSTKSQTATGSSAPTSSTSKPTTVAANGGSTVAPTAASSYKGFGPGNWPGSTWRPFADSSPWNRPVPANPALLTNSAGYTSDQMVSWLTGRGMPDDIMVNTGGSWDYSHPHYFAKDSDPLVTLKDTQYIGPNNNVTKIRIPLYAQARSAAAAGGDGHISIVQPDGSVCGAWKYTGTSNGIASASAWGL